MVIRFFKKSYLSRFVVLVLLTLLWWLPETIRILRLQETARLPFSPWLAFSAAVFVFLLTAFVVNNIGTGHRLSERNSYLIAFFFILTGSASGLTTIPDLFLPALFFFALFYQKVYSFQNSPNIVLSAFDAGLYLGLTSLFYPPALLLVLFIWFALVIYQTDQWRAYITTIIGGVLPWFFAFSGYFLFDKLPALWPWFLKYFHFREAVNPFHTPAGLALFGLITGVTLVAVLQILGNLQSVKINRRQHALVSLWGLIFTASAVLLFNPPLQAFLLITVPESLVLGMFFSQIKKLRWAERFVLLWILFVFVNQYLSLFHAA